MKGNSDEDVNEWAMKDKASKSQIKRGRLRLRIIGVLANSPNFLFAIMEGRK